MSTLKKFFERIYRKIWVKTKRKRICKEFRERNNNANFTILSQNCVGGVIYKNLGLPFLTPTINCFIEDESFAKLVEKPRFYLSKSAEPLIDCYVDSIDSSITYPKIKIEDIEICCLHYKNCNEAVAAWNRRRTRVNFDNLYIMANSWNTHGKKELIDRIGFLGDMGGGGHPTVIFTLAGEKYNNKCVELPGVFWKLDNRGIVRPNITDINPKTGYRYFEEFFDFVTWLNN